MKALVVAFKKEKALVGAFSVITNLRMELFEALLHSILCTRTERRDFGVIVIYQVWAGAAFATSRETRDGV